MEEFLKFGEVSEFLSDYPRGKWKICLDSIILYGVFSLKRDFPNGLSIPELIRISRQDPVQIHSPLESPTSIRSYSKTRCEDLPVKLLKIPVKTLNTEEQEKKLKTCGSQTLLSKNKSFNISREDIKNEDFELSEKIREPKIVSLENARKIMSTSSEVAYEKRRQNMGLSEWKGMEIKIDYMPKTISTELYKKERLSLGSPKYKY